MCTRRLLDSLKIQSIHVTPGSSGSSVLRIPPVDEVNALNTSFCDCQIKAILLFFRGKVHCPLTFTVVRRAASNPQLCADTSWMRSIQ
jgi:hypothetical protein